ncbi:MAG: hypothetical protein EZS28_056313, partial [Streblomastix strix]
SSQGSITKVYDGTPIVPSGQINLTGIVALDTVTATGSYNNANNGAGKTITYGLGGASALNYTLANGTGAITSLIISIQILSRVKAFVASDTNYKGFKINGIVNIDSIDVQVTAQTAGYTSTPNSPITFTLTGYPNNNYKLSTTVTGINAGSGYTLLLVDNSAGLGHILSGDGTATYFN